MTRAGAIAEPILHVDMDAFFVEVERRSDPSLRGVPVIIGGLGARGVVSTASYEARVFGVGSAMPMATARRLAPGAVYLQPDHGRYGAASREIFSVLRSFTPIVEPLSVDEAFLDVAGLRYHYEDAAAIAAAIREAIATDVGLPASVGAATSKFIAKVASDLAKPAGQLVVARGTEREFLAPLPVDRLWGVGAVTRRKLDELGITTIGGVAATPAGVLERRLGASMGEHLRSLARGVDQRTVEAGGGGPKSVSVEETYESDLTDADTIDRALLELSDRLARRLHRAGLAGRTVVLKLRYGDFTTVTRSHTESAPVRHGRDLHRIAVELLGRTASGRPVRLLGVGVSGLVDGADPEQLGLTEAARTAAADVVDEVRDRFGDDAIRPARLLGSGPSEPSDTPLR